MKHTHFYVNTGSGYENHDSKYYKTSHSQSAERARQEYRLHELERKRQDSGERIRYASEHLPGIPQGRSIPDDALKRKAVAGSTTATAAEPAIQSQQKPEDKKK